ncbi:hypothetical protein F5884DRAFT_505983 [Xylogone sp. PMI_703]|nr:hypothetical protein F5884DRAFT_505983 [Xylogone sp. PMI_703]
MDKSTSAAVEYSQRACNTCQVRKRKCDKALPSCSACTARLRKCEYTGRPPSLHVHQRFRELQGGNSNSCFPDSASAAVSSGSWIQPIDFPSTFFLDQQFFQQYRMQVPGAHLITASFPSRLLGNDSSIQKMLSKFFNTAHRWLPVISEEKFRSSLKSIPDLRSDVVLLLLSMKLLTSSPQESHGHVRTDLYLATKHYIVDTEIAGIISMEILTAVLFTSLYEIGHAMYPAAFLSVAACVRYGHALGLGVNGVLQTSLPLSHDELEERWRVWRSVLLLDRFVNLGCPTRQFAAEDTNSDFGKPSMEQEQMITSNINSSRRIDTGCFTLIAETTNLLTQVLMYQQLRGAVPYTDWQHSKEDEERIEQLSRTINSLIIASEVEAAKWGVRIRNELALCYSAALILQELYLNLEHQLLPHSKRENVEGCIDSILEKVVLMCKDWLSDPSWDIETTSPLALHCVYYAVIKFYQKGIVGKEKELIDNVKTLTNLMRTFEQRWKLAGSYLQILEAREISSIWS